MTTGSRSALVSSRVPAAVPLVLAAAAWGLGTALSKGAVGQVPPLTLLPLQLAVSVAALALVAVVGRVPLRERRPAILGWLGVLNPGLAYLLGLAGLAHVSTSVAVVLWATEPLVIALLAGLLGAAVRRRTIPVSIVAVAGIALIVGGPGGDVAPVGVALILAAVGCCAVYSVVTARWLPGAPSTIGVVAVQQAYALVFALVVVAVATVAGQAVIPDTLTIDAAGGVVASGLVYYALAYLLYIAALRRLTVVRAAASFYLIPVFGLAAGSLAGDVLGPVQWLGVAIVVAAVALGVSGKD